MHAQDRPCGQELQGEVPVRHRVGGVVEHPAEAQVCGGGHRIQRQRRAGKRCGPQGRHVGGPMGGKHPVEVPGEGEGVGEEVVGEEDRLRPLQVGVARGEGVPVGLRLTRQHRRQLVDACGDPQGCRLQPEPEVRGDEVVAGASGMDLGPHVTQAVGDVALHRRVDVLVGDVEHEPALAEQVGGLAQRRLDQSPLLGRQDAGPLQRPGVGPGGSDVLAPHPLVERKRVAERLHRGGRTTGEPARPQRLAAGHSPSAGASVRGEAGCARAHVFVRRPHSFTKPSAAVCSKASPVS